MRLGFVGTGAITAAIVKGLSAPDAERIPILVSPRNAATAASLAATFAHVAIASSNQAVLDGCDAVVLAVRPDLAARVLADLRFRPDHHIISLVGIISLRQIAAMVAPATRVTRAVPLPVVADRRGPTAVYPPDPLVAELFNRLGTAIEVAREDQFDGFCSVTATIASYFEFTETIAAWLGRHGVASDEAVDYVSTMFHALAAAQASVREPSLRSAAAEYATRGGINEQVLAHLTAHRVFQNLSSALDGVLARIKANAGPV